MPNPGTIEGTHHLTFCVGGAQEDYDFHVRTLGLKSVKKTVLFDGEIPIYHLYYANRVGDASTILTAFPYRQAGWMGKRGTNQAKSINLAVPAESIGYWADRLEGAGHRGQRGRALRHRAARVRAPVRHPVPDRRRDGARTRASPTAAATSRPSTRSAAPGAPRPPSASPSRWTSSCARRSTPSRSPPRAPTTSTSSRRRATAEILELVEEPDLPQGTWRFGEGTIHHHAFDVGTSENQLRGQGLHRRPRLHRRLRRQGPRLLLQRLPAHAGRRPVRARLLDAAGLHDRRARGRARHAHVHPAALGGPPLRDLVSSSRSTPSRPSRTSFRAGRGCSVARWRRYASRRDLVALAARRAGAAETVSGKLGAGTTKLPKSAKAGRAQVLAVNIDTMAYGAGGAGEPRRRVQAEPAGGQVGAAHRGRGAGQAVRVVHVGGDRDARRAGAARSRSRSSASRSRASQAEAPRPAPRVGANINPRDGQEYAGRGVRRSSRSRRRRRRGALRASATACRTCRRRSCSKAPVRVHDRRVVPARRDEAEIELSADRVRRSGDEDRGRAPDRSRDPHPRARGGPAGHAAAGGADRLARGREDRRPAVRGRQLGHALRRQASPASGASAS